MPFNLGVGEILLILLVLLLFFGARRLPELGGALGKGLREFKRSVREIETELSRPVDEETKELRAPPPGAATPPASRQELPGQAREQ